MIQDFTSVLLLPYTHTHTHTQSYPLLLCICHSSLLVKLVCLLSYFSYESLYICIPLPQLHLLHSQLGFQIFYLSNTGRDRDIKT